MCSHAPVVRLKNPGLLHSLEQCRSTHGCLVGKELVIPLLLHLLAPLLSTSLLLTPQASAFCLLQQAPSAFPGHRVTRKQAAPFFIFLAKTQVKTSSTTSSPGGDCVKQKLPDPENQMLSHQTKSAAPAVPETSCW